MNKLVPINDPRLGDAKGWKYGELTVMQSIDSIMSVPMLEANFGAGSKLPIARYKHTSISHKERYPTWEEITEIRDVLHGQVTVMQILPPKVNYVNTHEHCFHLWEIL